MTGRGRGPDGPSVGERLVYQRTQLGTERVGERRKQLGHEDHGQVLLRVDPERGAGRSTPVVLPDRSGGGGRGRPVADGEAQAESDPVELGLAESTRGETGQVASSGRWLQVINSSVLRPMMRRPRVRLRRGASGRSACSRPTWRPDRRRRTGTSADGGSRFRRDRP